MIQKSYWSPKVISHQAIKFETLISGSIEDPEEPGDPIYPIIDIKPSSDPSSYGGKGRIPVAVLGSADIDVLDIDDSTVRFGDREYEGAPQVQVGLEDFNKDGYQDKVYKFEFQATNLDPEDKIGYLSGKINGVDFVSKSDVNIK